MRSVAAIPLGVLVLFAAAFATSYVFAALGISNRGLVGPTYTAVTWGAGLAGQALAGYAAARAAGQAPYAHAIGVGIVVVAMALGPNLLQSVPDQWTVEAAGVYLPQLPGLLAGAWIVSRRGV
ncbi:MAG: hypothetical protein V3U67_01435 [Gemmatimonadota bacterium]